MNIKRDLTEEEKQFIRDHFEKIPVRELAGRMKRGAKTIYDFVKSEKLVITDGTRRSTRHHPWRKANHQLEIYTLTDKPKK
jgi:hypothetical protein